MKLLLIIVSIIAVFTVDGRDFNNEPEEAAQILTGGLKIQDSVEQDHKLKEEINQHERKLKRLRCKARNACVVMAGFCVTNATLCNGRLVPEGCKGTTCQCCVPGTIEAKFDNLEQELQSIKENMNSSNSNLNSELQSLKLNMNITNSNLKIDLQSLKDNINSELQSLKTNMNKSNSILDSEIKSLNINMDTSFLNMNSTLRNQGCPKGFFQQSAFNQCFKYFKDKGRSYTEAKSKCAEEGLVIAKPYDPIGLRSYIIMRYGDTAWPWIGAKGTGSRVYWDRDGSYIHSSNPMWYNGHPASKTSSSYCLMLAARASYMKDYPNQPLFMISCNSGQYTLCELLRE